MNNMKGNYMIVSFSFPYGKRATRAQIEKLSEITGQPSTDFASKFLEDTDASDFELKTWSKFKADLDDLKDVGVDVELSFSDDVPITAFLHIRQYLTSVSKKLDMLQTTISAQTAEGFNERLNVRVADNFLLNIKNVKVKENCCTDDLQSQLDEGWTLLAVCQQSDQRRPDYILGKN
jgi:hypothetical protein